MSCLHFSFLFFSAADLEKELAKVAAKIVAEEGLTGTETTRTGRYQESLEAMKGHFKTVYFHSPFEIFNR